VHCTRWRGIGGAYLDSSPYSIVPQIESSKYDRQADMLNEGFDSLDAGSSLAREDWSQGCARDSWAMSYVKCETSHATNFLVA
jgi:hypothetical protein